MRTQWGKVKAEDTAMDESGAQIDVKRWNHDHSQNAINVQREKAFAKALLLVPAASLCSFKHFQPN